MESASPPRQNRPESMAALKSSERPTDLNSHGAIVGMCVMLVVAVFLVFGQTLRHGFVNYDDDKYFFSNLPVQAGLTWNGVVWAFRTVFASNWHPLTWLSLMLDVELFGTGPAGPHLTNVILHAVNAVLLFLLLRRLTGLRSDKSVGASSPQAGTLWPSAFVAAVFAIHPLHVESVTWVAERKDVLSGLFFMLTLLMYARCVQGVTSDKWQVTGKGAAAAAPDSSRVTRHASLFYGLALLFFALGLMSKPMLVTVPFVLLLLDWWPLGRVTSLRQASARQASDQPSLRSFGPAGEWQVTRLQIPVPQLSSFNHLLLEKLPFFLLSAASCVVTILVQREAIKSMIVLPFTLRFGNALISYVTYIVQTIWPENLAVFYPYRFDVPVWQIAGAGVLLLSVTVLVMVAAKRFPYLPVCWLWYLGMLVPMIGVVHVGSVARADRFTYLAQIGVYILLTWTVVELTASWRSRRWVLGGGAMVVLAVLITCARAQTAYWHDSELLWTHTLACTLSNSIAHNNLGSAFRDQGRMEEAIAELQKALAINPDYAEAHYNLGNAFLQQGRMEEAIAQYQMALEIMPDDEEVHNNLGNVFLQQGRMEEAISCYQKALEINPNHAKAHNNLGNAFRQQGRLEEAIAHFQKALAINPDYAEVHNNLGVVFTQQGRIEGAISQFQKALEIKPDYAEAHYNLGNAFLQQGHVEEAIAHFQKALAIKPDYAEAQNNMAWVLATCPQASLRNGIKAVGLAERANQLTSGENPVILATLAAAYAEAGRFPEAIETVQRALHLAEAQSNTALAGALQSQLKLYQAGLPFHVTEQAH